MILGKPTSPLAERRLIALNAPFIPHRHPGCTHYSADMTFTASSRRTIFVNYVPVNLLQKLESRAYFATSSSVDYAGDYLLAAITICQICDEPAATRREWSVERDVHSIISGEHEYTLYSMSVSN